MAVWKETEIKTHSPTHDHTHTHRPTGTQAAASAIKAINQPLLQAIKKRKIVILTDASATSPLQFVWQRHTMEPLFVSKHTVAISCRWNWQSMKWQQRPIREPETVCRSRSTEHTHKGFEVLWGVPNLFKFFGSFFFVFFFGFYSHSIYKS